MMNFKTIGQKELLQYAWNGLYSDMKLWSGMTERYDKDGDDARADMAYRIFDEVVAKMEEIEEAIKELEEQEVRA